MIQLLKAATARLLRVAACALALLPAGFLQSAHAAPPMLVLGAPVDAGTYPASFVILFAVVGSETATYQCSLDGQPIDPCVSGHTVTGLAHGPHAFHITATNEASEATSLVSNLLVDAVAPTITDVSPQGVNGTSVTLSFASSDTETDGTTFECFLDGQQYTPCSPNVPVQVTNLFDGPHELTIFARDSVGNANTFASPFVVDGRGPIFDPDETRVPLGSACPRSTEDTQILFGAEDARVSTPIRYTCALNGGQEARCNPANAGDPRFNWRCLAAGSYQLTVLAYDRFDNRSDPLDLAFSVERAAGCPVNACAGPDRSVDELGTTMLDGSLSTGDVFSWAQIAGPDAGFDPAAQSPTVATPPLAGSAGSQVLTFRLTVTGAASGESDSDTVDVTVRNGNLAPVADAGADQTVREGAPVTLSAALSYDPDGDALAVHEWVQTEGLAVTLSDAGAAQPTFTAPLLAGGLSGPQQLRFRLRVSDGALFSAPDEVGVTVEQVNHPPLADAGADQTKLEGASVTLAGSGSDPDADPLRYSWMQILGDPVVLANVDTPTASFTAPAVPEGGTTLAFRLTVSDNVLEGIDEVLVNLRKRSDPPLCHLARPSSRYLWPPNHKLVPITIQGVTDPDSPSITITITGIMQDERVTGTGDGDTAPDAVLQGSSVLLRAERDGAGNGRVYRVAFTADDGSGGSCTGAVDVVVPHNARATSAGNDGLVYDSTGR